VKMLQTPVKCFSCLKRKQPNPWIPNDGWSRTVYPLSSYKIKLVTAMFSQRIWSLRIRKVTYSKIQSRQCGHFLSHCTRKAENSGHVHTRKVTDVGLTAVNAPSSAGSLRYW
jgi:hypothetical protein